MNVKKILKFYLVLSLVMTGTFSLGNSEVFKNYFPEYYQKISAFSNDVFGDDYKYLKKNSFASTLNTNILDSKVDKQLSKKEQQNFSFEIVNDIKKSFGIPGENGLKIMEYKFKTNDEGLDVKNLKLKIVGAQGDQFEKLYLNDENGKTFATGNIGTEFVEFKNLNFAVEPDSSQSLLLVADLSDSFRTGERFRFDLINAEDIEIILAKQPSQINSYYPIRGPYISIAKARAFQHPPMPSQAPSSENL